MAEITITINGNVVHTHEGATILEASRQDKYAALQYDVKIPMIQYLKGVKAEDTSGISVVEVVGIDGLVNASTALAKQDMEVLTHTEAVIAAQQKALAEILAVHDLDCRNCKRTGNCELQTLQWQFRQTKDPTVAKVKTEPIQEGGIIVRELSYLLGLNADQRNAVLVRAVRLNGCQDILTFSCLGEERVGKNHGARNEACCNAGTRNLDPLKILKVAALITGEIGRKLNVSTLGALTSQNLALIQRVIEFFND